MCNCQSTTDKYSPADQAALAKPITDCVCDSSTKDSAECTDCTRPPAHAKQQTEDVISSVAFIKYVNNDGLAEVSTNYNVHAAPLTDRTDRPESDSDCRVDVGNDRGNAATLKSVS